MGLNLKDEETVALVTEVARRLGTSKTGAVRELARQKLIELDGSADAAVHERTATLLSFLQADIWPHTDGKTISPREIDEMLGYPE